MSFLKDLSLDGPSAVDPTRYETKLSPAEETNFQQWKQKYAPRDSGMDYDLRGAFKAGLSPDPASGHWPDTYKKPNHPTFSNESIYAKDRPELAGSWKDNVFIPPTGQTGPITDLTVDTADAELPAGTVTLSSALPDEFKNGTPLDPEGRFIAGRNGVVFDRKAGKPVDSTFITEDPEIFGSLKGRIAELFTPQTLWNTAKPTQALKGWQNMAKTAFGVGELAAVGISQLGLSLLGLGQLGAKTAVMTVQDSINDGTLTDPSQIGRRYVQNLLLNGKDFPEDLGKLLDSWTYHPISDAGDAMVGLTSLGLGRLAENATEWGNVTLDKTGSPALATAVRVAPEALLMFAGAAGGKKVAKSQATTLAVDAIGARIRSARSGDKLELFDDSVKKAYENLDNETNRELQRIQAIYVSIFNKPNKTAEDVATMDSLRTQIDEMQRKGAAYEQNQMVRLQDIDEVMALAKTEIPEGATAADIVNPSLVSDYLSGRKKIGGVLEVVVDGAQFKITSGINEAIAAYLGGIKKMPVRYRYRVMDEATQKKLSGEFNEVWSKSNELRDQILAGQQLPFFTKLAKAWWDDKAAMKRSLWDTVPTSGKFPELTTAVADVQRAYELIHGSPTAGLWHAQRAVEQIYGGLDEKHSELLNKVIFAKRIQQITDYKGIQWRAPGGLSAAHAKAMLKEVADQVGPAAYDQLLKRSQSYAEANKAILKLLYQEGLLKKRDYDKMNGLDYAKIKYLEWLEPELATKKKDKKKVSVEKSGVEKLGTGGRDLIETDFKKMLVDHTVAAYSRIFKNRANAALGRLADAVPDNGIVQRGRKRKEPGDEVVFYRERGKKRSLTLQRDFAADWATTNSELATQILEGVRLVSLNRLVKEAAVGRNPTFWLKDFPRSMMQIMLMGNRTLEGTRLYAPEALTRAAQMASDFWAVAGDAYKYGPKTQQFIDNGGGAYFLVHYSRGELSRAGERMAAGQSAASKPIKDVLGRMNEWADLTSRLMVTERALKRGLSYRQAVYEGRSILDYAQFGTFGRAVDAMLPFFNPALQATRSAVRGVKRDPKAAAFIASEVAVAAGINWMLNYTRNPEAVQNISDMDWATGIPFVMPQAITYTDAAGERVDTMLKLTVDSTWMPVIASVHAAMNRYFLGKDPGEVYKWMLKSAPGAGIVTTVSPQADAIAKYNGLDIFFGNQVTAKKGEVYPYAEYTATGRNATPEFYVEAAKFLQEQGILTDAHSLSPDRTRAVVDTLLANNPLLVAAYQAMPALGAETDYQAEMSRREAVGAFIAGVSSSVVKEVRPTSRTFEAILEYEKDTPTVQKLANDEVDKLTNEFKAGKLPLNDMVRKAINIGTPYGPEEIKRLSDRAVNNAAVALAYKAVKPEGLPPSYMMGRLAAMRPVDRARTAFSIYSMMGEKDRPRFWELMVRTQAGGYNFISSEFMMEWTRLKTKYSKDLPTDTGVRWHDESKPDLRK